MSQSLLRSCCIALLLPGRHQTAQLAALQIGSAEQFAQAGDVILSPEVTSVTAGHCSVDPLEGNNSRLVSMSQQEVVSMSRASACD